MLPLTYIEYLLYFIILFHFIFCISHLGVIGLLYMAYPDGCCVLPPMIWLISKLLTLHVNSLGSVDI